MRFLFYDVASTPVVIKGLTTQIHTPHIIIKFKNKKVSLFLKIVALCSSVGGKNDRYIILIPIWIDSVMIYCCKSIEIK